jgi:hypothetical protein
VNVQALRVTKHATERFRIHHPDAVSWDEIKTHVRFGTEVSGDVLAQALCWKQARRGTRYVLSPDRRGVFVISNNADGSVVLVTYLRLGLRHYEWALNEWPLGPLG